LLPCTALKMRLLNFSSKVRARNMLFNLLGRT
jgi:hypothetical protein